MYNSFPKILGIQEYQNFVSECINNNELFRSFKRNENYIKILEHVNFELAQEYLKIIESDNPHLLDEILKFKLNDIVGNPVVKNFPKIGSISPSTLRYVKVLSDILKIFNKKKFKKIAEIGVGYGGQFVIFDQLLSFSEYYLLDLKKVFLFSEKYLNNFFINNSYKKKHINNINNEEVFDLVISNYSFSELPTELQLIYLHKIILKSKRGYLTMNSGKKNSIFYGNFLSLEKLKSMMPYIKIIPEEPQKLVHPGNYIIIWEK